MVPLGYAIANPTYNNYESQGGFGLGDILSIKSSNLLKTYATGIYLL
ncbi:MAG: hypothetical protein QNJ51_13175 [Calothrix sp. MO_167.B12]|nr:hypothetical protein [Calothrix sp. MO_167.B12]